MQGHTDAGAREARRGREADAGAGDARRGHARACEESLLHGGDLLGRRAADYVHSEIAQREIPREIAESRVSRVESVPFPGNERWELEIYLFRSFVLW